MLLNLIVYVVAVSFLLGLAAWALERAVRTFTFPTRWIWLGAMVGPLAYLLLAILRPATSSQPLGAVIATPLDVLLIPIVGSITRLAEVSSSGINLEPLLAAGWAVWTFVVAAVLLRAQLRLRSDRFTWTPAELHGRDVLVSEDLGPGVVGWIRSVIVMPRWALRMPPQKRELMLQHEGEHCHAGDTRVAGFSLLLLTLLPWNLPLWWQVYRLRVAIEIDCDHRVLHRSADVKRYAKLLVEIGARRTASPWSALAFARPIPPIERRILAMTETRKDPKYIRIVGLTLLAALLVVASCGVDQPPTTAATSGSSEGDERMVVPRTEAFEVGVEPVVIDSVDVEGNIRQTDLTIIAMGGLNPGSAYTISDIQRATESIWATGQFRDVRVRVEGEVGDGMVTLIWEVDEQDLEVPLPNAAADPPAVRGQQSNLRLASQQVSDEERIARIRNAMAKQAAEARAFIEELQARRAEAVTPAQAVPQELRPEDRAAIQAGPVFTPMTVQPEILNRNEIVATLIREYPPLLRDAGTGGTVEVWFYVSETGQTLHTRVSDGSGYPELDAAALRVGAAFRFSAATYRDQSVPVWIQLPITFEVAQN